MAQVWKIRCFGKQEHKENTWEKNSCKRYRMETNTNIPNPIFFDFSKNLKQDE